MEKHLNDYRALRRDVDKLLAAIYETRDGMEYSVRDDVRAVLSLLKEVAGGLKVLKFIGWVLSTGFLVTIWHALQYVFAAKIK